MIARTGKSDRMVILKKPFDAIEVLQLAHALTEKWQLLQDAKRKFADLEELVAERTRALKTANASLESEIRQHKRAAEVLHEQAVLLDLASDAIFVRDLGNRIHFWNHGAERLYGWTAAEATGGKLGEFLTGERFAPRDAQDALLKKGEWNGELQRQTKDGGKVIVNSRWTLLRDPEGAPKSILTIDTDVTEKKKLETQFLRTQRMEAIGTLATGMAHDLNNILAPVLIGTEMLRWPLQPKEFEETVARIESCTKRGAEIIKQVLTFGRGADGTRILLQPRHLIGEIVTMIRQTFPKSINITSQTPRDLWNIEADRTQIQQVLLNVCVNARDAMPHGGSLALQAENMVLDEAHARFGAEAKPGPYVLIQVSDSGTGIPPEIIERIFDPFFTTKAHGKGTGLGLSTAVGIVRSHGGHIGVSSEPEKGAVFKILLPACPESHLPESNPPVTPSSLPRGEGEIILLVDDEAEILRGNEKLLQRHNYNVLTAADGAQGLAVFEHHRLSIRLVITDIRMPQADGLALIRSLKKLDTRIPIIASSGLARSLGLAEKPAELDSLHIERFLLKPYSAETLLTAISEVLRQSRPS
jgi:PAS domain S-box-containing protein